MKEPSKILLVSQNVMLKAGHAQLMQKAAAFENILLKYSIQKFNMERCQNDYDEKPFLDFSVQPNSTSTCTFVAMLVCANINCALF